MSQLRSKHIKDYFSATLSDLIPGRELTFDVHLYFSANNHILLWLGKGSLLSESWLQKYLLKGAKVIWIHRSEEEAFQLYIKNLRKAEPEAEIIASVLDSPALNADEKKAIVQEVAHQVISATLHSPREVKRAQKFVHDLIAQTLKDAHPAAREALKFAQLDPDLDHGLNTATFAVIFALAFGQIDRGLLSDLALAALLHDLGLSQIPLPIVRTAQQYLEGAARDTYTQHVEEGIRILKTFAPTLATGPFQRAIEIATQHHERFSGTGYPKGIQGFEFDDIAQLLSMADLFESFSNGDWDGQTRTVYESIMALKALEKSQAFPVYFNPDLFNIVLGWVGEQHQGESSSFDSAIEVVKAQITRIVNGNEHPQSKASRD